MKKLTKQMRDFILAFDLANPIAGVCFNASVYFYSDKLNLEIESEIHIITIQEKNVDVLYILNPEIRQNGFPDMFESSNCEIDFREKKGLLIKYTDSESTSYSILIQPSGKNCEPAMMQDFQAKIGIDETSIMN